jgi:DNA-binding MarR family transcriptional regulator
MHTPSQNVIGAWALQAADLMSADIGQAGLGDREGAALVLVATHPGSGIDWLRSRLGLTHSGTVRLVDRLVEHGLLVRGPGSTRRVVRLQVTASGERRVEEITAARARALDRMLSSLTDAERQVFADLAGRMLRTLERDRTAADRTCRLCDWSSCTPACPVSESVAEG